MRNHLTTLISLVIASGMVLAWTPAARAQGIIIDPMQIERWVPPRPIGPWPVQPITLERESIEIELDDQFAHVRSTQIFRNNTGMDLEGTYVFPLPHDADISDFALWMDGRQMTAETLDADEAAQIYRSIVAQMRDPGLLEYMGDGLIRASVYPIPAHGTKQVDIEYDWLLPIESGLIRLTMPLKLDGYSIDMVQTLAITVRIDSPDTLGTIYSPTHDVDVRRDGPRRATVSMEKSSFRPTGDFVLYISRPEGAVGLNMLTHATGDDEGYFLAMIAPEYDESRLTIVPKDFICVLDTSGSMSGQKIEQAKDALDFIFRNLNRDDHFSLITFATDVYPYFDGWRDASSRNISDVRDYIEGLDAGGSTNIDGALDEALNLRSGRERPMYVIFVTDGLPTVGQCNTSVIIENANAHNSEVNARVFCFGVGDDVDYSFIDRLSRENGGYTASVAPNEDMEQPLSDFYAKIKSPVMTGIEIDIQGTRVYDMLPVDLPDLFLGSQLILAGRYRGTGNVTVRLTGAVGDDDVTHSYRVNFKDTSSNDFIPRHWATRRVGYLLNQVRLYGEEQEVVDEIVELARRYGIITPYTSMLVTEDEVPWPVPGRPFRGVPEWSANGLGGGTGALGAPSAPGAAREQSVELEKMESGDYEGEMVEELQETVRYAGDKTFYVNEDGYWVDSEYDEEEYEPIRITYLSDEYFDLVMDEPDLADYLAVGESVIVIWNGIAYQIDPEE